MEERKSAFYCCDKALWLFKSGWPQVPLILGGLGVSVGDWCVFSCLTVRLLWTVKVEFKCCSYFSSSQSTHCRRYIHFSKRRRKVPQLQESGPKKIHEKFDWDSSAESPSSTGISLRQEQPCWAWLEACKHSITIRLTPQGKGQTEQEKMKLLSELSKVFYAVIGDLSTSIYTQNVKT